MNVIRHIVGEMIDGVQCCVLCGTVICDYRYGVWCGDGGPPKGFEAGILYVGGKNPTVYFNDPKSLDDNDRVYYCEEERV